MDSWVTASNPRNKIFRCTSFKDQCYMAWTFRRQITSYQILQAILRLVKSWFTPTKQHSIVTLSGSEVTLWRWIIWSTSRYDHPTHFMHLSYRDDSLHPHMEYLHQQNCIDICMEQVLAVFEVLIKPHRCLQIISIPTHKLNKLKRRK